MDLISDRPYWLMKHGIPYSYPSLQKNIKTDVAIMGSGISGALTAWHLVNAGYNIAVIDRRHVATGSTAASTSLLQYEIDTPLHVLADNIGERNAVRAYRLCLESISKLHGLCSGIINTDFESLPSLQFASFNSHIKRLEKEYEMRKRHGFDVNWMEEADLKTLFGLNAPAGMLSAVAGGMDAYSATHNLLNECRLQGCNIYDNTEVISIEHHKNTITLKTDIGALIKAKKLVVACGYESLKYIPKKIADLYSTYAIVTEPVASDNIWHQRALIWETAMPYLYFRITRDNRILMGGKDDPFYNPQKRDAAIKRKTRALETAFEKRFNGIKIRTDFRWAGTFAGTSDGLPYIGSIPQRPNTYFALGFGGNGITYSLIAAKILTDLMLGNKNTDADLFSFDR